MSFHLKVMDEWPLLIAMLPEDWRRKATELGALRRVRQVRSAETLLRLLLMHLGCGFSLRDTVEQGRLCGLAQLSDVGLWYRLRQSGAWLQYLVTALLERLRPAAPALAPLATRRLLAVDGTLVREEGPTGSNWRVHYQLDVVTGAVGDVQLSDPHSAESLTRFTFAPGDVVLADRGYSRPGEIAHLLAAGADAICRFKLGSMVLLDRAGRPFDVVAAVRRIGLNQVGDLPVLVKWAGGTFPARLCVVKRSAAATAREQRRIRDRRRRKGTRAPRPVTDAMAAYTMLLTTLPATIPATTIFAVYAARWQVELAIKRHKQLFALGHLPKRRPASIHAWLQGKLLLILLSETLRREAQAFSPWGYPLQPAAADAVA